MNSKAIKRQLLAAIAMVLVAALALGSSTYAWFAAQNDVTATGMSVTAQSDGGIVIAEEPASGEQPEWFTTVEVSHGTASLYPTSTINLSNWYSSSSPEFDDPNDMQTKADAYKLINSDLDSYRLLTKFRIRSATGSDLAAPIAIKSINIAGSATDDDQPLSKAIRVGVEIGDQFLIYAPKNTKDFTLNAYYAKTDDKVPTLVERISASAAAADTFSHVTSIPANANGVAVNVYMWYEGEDEQCKSSNLEATNETLTATIVFTALVPKNA